MSRLKRVTSVVALLAVAGLIASCGASTDDPRDSSSESPASSSEEAPASDDAGTETDSDAEASEPSPLDLNLAKDDAIAAMVPEDLASSGVIRYTTDASYPPNEFIKEGETEPRGMSIDLGNAIAQLMGLEAQWTNADFDGILAGLEAGRADMSISSFTDTKKREEVVNFVTYLQAGTSIVVAKGNPNNVQAATDLCGLEIGAENGTTQYDMLTLADVDDSVVQICADAGKDAPVAKGFPTQNDVNAALDAGRIAAYMADTPVAVWAVETTGDRFEKVGADVGVAPYGVAVPKEPAELADAVQAAIQKLMDDGGYMQILENWGLADEAIEKSEINAAVF